MSFTDGKNISTPYWRVSQKLGFDRELPYTENWSAAEDFISLITDYCLAEKPEVIVECSSGLTTLALARCCQINNSGHVFSLENGQEYVDKTNAELASFGLSAYSTVIFAPLMKTRIDEMDFQWYQTDDIDHFVSKIDMLVIDGPPGFIQPLSRYPALPLFYEKLAEHAVIFLDDAARNDEKIVVQRWLSQFEKLKQYYYDTGRGCSVLSL